MARSRTVRAYDYVAEPYEEVRDAIRARALTLVQRATRLAEARSEEIVASLEVGLPEPGERPEIGITVRSISEETVCHDPVCRVTRVALEWRSSASSRYFPAMKAELRVVPLGPAETHVEVSGEYEPTQGVLAPTLDAAMGHLIAEASLHRFVRALVEGLPREL